MIKSITPLKNVLNQCTSDDWYEGMHWYHEAHAFAAELADMSGHSLDTICRVIAALSPAVNWEQNKKDAAALSLSSTPEHVTVSTYGSNKTKAIAILNGNPDVLRGNKVTSFYKNIKDPYCDKHVTIDRHAFKACIAATKRKSGGVTVTPKAYRAASALYKRLAQELSLTPSQLQAIVWCGYRKQAGVA